MHVVGVVFLLRQNTLQHDARGRVLFAEEADEVAVMFQGDAFCDEVLFDHLDQLVGVPVFGRRARAPRILA
jgi:hypothetical protein